MDPAIFISFASNDRKAADTICSAIERRGMHCWIATRNIGPGENFQEAITRAIRNAKVMILVFSGHANNSLEVKKEIALAGRYSVVVVPVRVEDVVPNDALSYELAVRQWIDMFEDWEHAIERLVSQVAAVVGVEPTHEDAAMSTAAAAPPPPRPPMPTPAASATAPPPPARTRSPMMYAAVGGAAVLVVVGGVFVWQSRSGSHHGASPAQMAAVSAPATPSSSPAATPPAPATPASPAPAVHSSAPVTAAAPPQPSAPPVVPQSTSERAIPSIGQLVPQPAAQPQGTTPPPAPPTEAQPGEMPRLEALQRAASAMRERRAEMGLPPIMERPAGEARETPGEALRQAAASLRGPGKPATGPERFRDCPNCPPMVMVRAGRFEMGGSRAEHERFGVPPRLAEHETPQHTVTIAKAFALGEFEVTRGEFAAFVRATNYPLTRGCTGPVEGKPTHNPEWSWENPGFQQTEREPVVCVNMADIEAYLEWLQRQTGKPYRLPTEAEWEYAARGGTTTPFYWGDNPDQVCEYENIGDQTAKERFAGDFVAMPCRDGYVRTSPVGAFKANPFGLHDMLGNVFEFTADCWAPGYSGAPTDGSARATPGCSAQVIRKASFGNGQPVAFRAAHRVGEAGNIKRNRVGFRVALTLP